MDVEEAVLLAGEARLGQVLGRPGAANGDRPGPELPPRGDDLCGQRLRQRGVEQGPGGDIITRAQCLGQGTLDSGGLKVGVVRVGGDDEAVGHRKTGTQEFGEVRALASQQRRGGSLFEPTDGGHW